MLSLREFLWCTFRVHPLCIFLDYVVFEKISPVYFSRNFILPMEPLLSIVSVRLSLWPTMCCSFYLWDLVLIEFSMCCCNICEICFCLYFFNHSCTLLWLAIFTWT
uniref:Uncharacterized protein n=1 Tax=Arundo donax TaxID=35708 RepID=A0A0A9HVI8_ARUDO